MLKILKLKNYQFFGLLVFLGLLFFSARGGPASGRGWYFLSDDWHWLYLAKNRVWSWDIFMTNYEGLQVGGSYNPLSFLVFKIFYNLFHLKAGFYHLVSILVHSLNAYLVFILVNKIFVQDETKKYLAYSTAILFLLWPTQTEIVNWLAAWPHLWASTFYLLSFIYYLNYRQKDKAKFLGLSLLFFIISLGFKENALSLPILIFLWEAYLFSKKAVKNWSWAFSAYLLLLAAFLFLRQLITGALFGYYGQSQLDTSLLAYFANLLAFLSSQFTFGVVNIWFYKFYYHYLDLLFIFGASFLSLYFFFTWYYKKWQQFTLVVSGMIVLLPMLPLGLHHLNFAGERYMYLSSAFIIVWFLVLISESGLSAKKMSYLCIILSVVILFPLEIKNNIWQQANTLSRRIISSYQDLKLAPDVKLISVGLPDNLSGAEVFRNNLQQALELSYPNYKGEIKTLPAYLFLNTKNKNDHLLKWRQDALGWFVESVDGQFVVTGQTSIIKDNVYFELWNYNYQNYTANLMRLMPAEELKQQLLRGEVKWLTFDRGRLIVY
ncbi:MAG: hypothetical protein UR94_C0004G0018 [Parcubacteria group bacterium GW2011_GWA2_36_10]|nr:MAG: hypothetical protein UR94_C0004G0018 [Parcubacteria group bacterium GW2011_GWA2_36_10]